MLTAVNPARPTLPHTTHQPLSTGLDREVRELPEPPRQLWRIVGPGIVAAGVGLSSGEFILWPLIASQVGLVFLWGAVLGVMTQFFLNMEIERYTLATGETAMTGFNRFWKHWGLVLAKFGQLPDDGGGIQRLENFGKIEFPIARGRHGIKPRPRV